MGERRAPGDFMKNREDQLAAELEKTREIGGVKYKVIKLDESHKEGDYFTVEDIKRLLGEGNVMDKDSEDHFLDNVEDIPPEWESLHLITGSHSPGSEWVSTFRFQGRWFRDSDRFPLPFMMHNDYLLAKVEEETAEEAKTE